MILEPEADTFLFRIAKRYPGCEVIGLDIVRDALEVNRAKTKEEGIRNLSFVSYNGIDFPFESDSFDLIVTRYALHHFPDIEYGIEEVSRVLKTNGMLFISDPCPNECDYDRFVDDYMQLKKTAISSFTQWASGVIFAVIMVFMLWIPLKAQSAFQGKKIQYLDINRYLESMIKL